MDMLRNKSKSTRYNGNADKVVTRSAQAATRLSTQASAQASIHQSESESKTEYIADKIIPSNALTKLQITGEKIRNKISVDEYIKWYNLEYMKQWEFEKSPNVAKLPIETNIGSVIRMQNISAMKSFIQYNNMTTIVVVMSLYDNSIKKEINYGTLFCDFIQNITPSFLELHDNRAIHGNVIFMYYSSTPSFISCDGEYRAQFSKYLYINKIKRMYINIWNEIDEYVNRIKVRRQWHTYISYYYPGNNIEDKYLAVENAVRSEMVGSTLLTIAWFHAIFNEMVGMTKSHLNPVFKEVFLNDTKTDIIFLESLIKKYGGEYIKDFRDSFFILANKNLQGTYIRLQCGYKMSPLNNKEVQNPLKLRSKPWREYIISNKCNDLIINSIAPSFSIMNDWFYIRNSKRGLYDNKSQYIRMKNSDVAKNILHHLYEAQRETYFITESMPGVNKSSSGIKKYIDSKFKKLSDKIEEPINYTLEDIIISDVTLGFSNELIGNTFSDIFTMVKKTPSYNKELGYPFKDIGYDYFAKYMFDICYGLYCINSKLGILHGDFHLNNATIGQLYQPPESVLTNGNKYMVVYVIDEQQYVFPNNTYFGCIIDFSRAIINPERYIDLTDISLPSSFTLVDNDNKFSMNEASSLVNIYTQIFPNKLAQKEELIFLLRNNFEAGFKLLTCIDLYMFSIRLGRLFRQSEQPVGSKVLELVDKLAKLSEVYITTDINKLLEDTKEQSDKILAAEYPILTIIKKCFSEYLDGVIYKTPGIISDVYIYNNEMKYSIAKFDTFPEIFKTGKYMQNNKLVEIKELADRRKLILNEYEKQKLHNLELLKHVAMQNES
jgi:hypothetical protein